MINSHVIKPNNKPEIPILHGIEGKTRYIMTSSTDAVTKRLVMRIINFFAPNERSIREREYKPSKLPIRWYRSICTKLFTKIVPKFF